MRFIIFVIDGPGHPASTDEMVHIDAFNEKLQEKGYWIAAAGIREASAATVIDNRANKGEVVAGSLFKDYPDFYTGFWIIEVDSEELALELAKEGSHACNRKVELRPYIR